MRLPFFAGVAAAVLVAGCSGRAASSGSGGPGGTAGADPGAAPRSAWTGTTHRLPGSMRPVAGSRIGRHPAALPTATARVVRWRLPEPVAREVVIGTATGAVVAGGLVAGDASTPRAYRIELRSGAQLRLPDLSVAVHDAAGADLDGTALVIGGGGATEQDVVQRLGAGPTWHVVGRLPGPRADLVTARVDGRLVVLGGYDGSTSPGAILVSSHGRVFRAVGRLAVAVRYPAVAVVDGAVWLFGGEHDGQLTDVVQRVDPKTGRDRVVTHLPHPLAHAAAAVIRGDVLLAGGRTGADAVTSAIRWFDPSNLTFRLGGHLPYPVADAGVVTARRATWLLGGETPGLTDRVTRVVAR